MPPSVSPLQPVRHEEPGPVRLARLLDELPSPAGAVTLMLAAGATPDDILLAEDSATLRATLEELGTGSRGFESGLMLFWSPRLAYAVRPPLPPLATSRFIGWDVAALLDLLGRPYILGVFLLRRGGYTVGVFEGDVLVASKTDARFVKNRHRKGGQSQRRFDRIREKQVDELFAKACEDAKGRLQPYNGRLDALFLGGDKHTVQAFLGQCRYLAEFGPRLLARFLNVPEPRQRTLQFAYDMIWRSDWTLLRDQPAEDPADLSQPGRSPNPDGGAR